MPIHDHSICKIAQIDFTNPTRKLEEVNLSQLSYR